MSDQPTNSLAPLNFANGEFDLAFHPDGNGGWWIPATPVARALGFRDAAAMLRTIPGEEKWLAPVCTPGGEQRVWCLTLPGFFRILGQRQAARIKDSSVRESVVRFQDWNYGEVLPSIAATGSYSATPQPAAPAIPTTFADALQLAADQAREIERKTTELEVSEAKVAELEPAARAWHGLAEADKEGVSTLIASKELRGAGADIGDQELHRYMADKGLIYRAGHTGRWTTTRYAEDKGLLRMKRDTGTHRSRDDDRKPNAPSVRVLAAGLEYLLSVLVAERGSTKAHRGQTAMTLVIR